VSTSWTPPGDGAQVDSDTPGFDVPFARACVLLEKVPNTLNQWRARGMGPRWRKSGPHRNDPIFYSEAELQAVLADMHAFRAGETKLAVRHRIDKASKARPRRPRKTPIT
jgi:hypothetical protein